MPLSADEPIRTLIAIDMIYDGNYISPKLNGETYLNKPPLYNWILVGFIKIFGSVEEWVIRLPSILSLLLFAGVIGYITNKELPNKKVGWIVGLSFLTTGNIIIYSSYLGHIDITYSLVTFLQIYLLYHFSSKNKWWQAFTVSYGLAFVGFMMKGLPSIVFQGISILVLLYVFKSIRKLISKEHVVSSLVFVFPLLLYLYLFSLNDDVSSLLNKLVLESGSRTIADKSFMESISHIFTFPFTYFVDIFPWGIMSLILFSSSSRKIIRSNPFLKICLLLFLSNIIVYWLSPDYRARYVFMLTPFLLIPSIYCFRILVPLKWTKRITVGVGVAVLLSIVGMYVYANYSSQSYVSPFNFFVLIILGGFMLFGIFRNKNRKYFYYFLVFSLAMGRIGYSYYMVPYRVMSGPYLTEKLEGEEIAKITHGEPLAMYNCNVSNTMNWYITINRHKSLCTVTEDYSFDSYYLVPTEVIKDTSNITTYYTFVRRFESKPFSLVKFKYRFPEMPK